LPRARPRWRAPGSISNYATIRAPIGGRIGAAHATEGALVVQNDTANLATIQQLDTIYADFTQSVAELNRLRRSIESGDLERIAPDAVKVRLVLDDGAAYAIPASSCSPRPGSTHRPAR